MCVNLYLYVCMQIYMYICMYVCILFPSIHLSNHIFFELIDLKTYLKASTTCRESSAENLNVPSPTTALWYI